jgi:light-regulated signal transduction histidine kinase (bacteriophytochrome)
MAMNSENLLVSFFIDITKIIEQQTVIEKHVQQLEAVNKELEAFSYSVSHDLRAPLRAIGGYAKILEEDFYEHLDDDGKKILTAVQDNARQMNILIDGLLEFAKLGKRSLVKNPIDMNSLTAQLLANLNTSQPHKAEVIVGTLHAMSGDPGLMRQVMVNLVSNAIKYSSKKDSPRVEITSKTVDGFIEYTVCDNGSGFDMKYADKLFGVFQRLHKDSEFEGTGIGLATVQRIIIKHGGTIYAEAEPDKGASFHFRIPLSSDFKFQVSDQSDMKPEI